MHPSTSAQQFEEMLQCAICYDSLDHPFRLPNCSHNFCQRCLEQQAAARDGVLSCASCRTEYVLPPGGVGGLIPDRTLHELIEFLRCSNCGTVDQFTDACGHCLQRCCTNCSCEHRVEGIRTSIHELALRAPDPNTQLTNWLAFQEKNKEERNMSDEKISNLISCLEIRKDAILKMYEDFDKYAQQQIDFLGYMEEIRKVLEDIEASLTVRENCVEEIKTAEELFETCKKFVSYRPRIEHVPPTLGTVMTWRLEWEVGGVGSQILQRRIGEIDSESQFLQSHNDIVLFKLDENASTFNLFAKGKMRISRDKQGLYELHTIDENGEGRSLLHWNNHDRAFPRFEARAELISWSLTTPNGQQATFAVGAPRTYLYNFRNLLDHV